MDASAYLFLERPSSSPTHLGSSWRVGRAWAVGVGSCRLWGPFQHLLQSGFGRVPGGEASPQVVVRLLVGARIWGQIALAIAHSLPPTPGMLWREKHQSAYRKRLPPAHV